MATALKPFLAQRNAIVIWAVIAVVVVLLALLAVWWWLVGRNARNVSAELLQLYQISNQQKQLLDGINSALVDGIVLTDKGGMVQYANQAFARMVGRSDEELVGMDCAAIFGYDTALRLYKQLDVAIQSEQSFMFKDVMWLQSKKYRYQITCSPYRNESGVITGTVSVFRDITQLVDAQERNQRMVRQTIAAFMHAIEAVDPYLGGQSSYMANLGGDLVKTLGLSEEDESTVRTAASLSQIGKCSCPASCADQARRLHAGRASGYGAACGICPGDLEEHQLRTARRGSHFPDERVYGRFRVSRKAARGRDRHLRPHPVGCEHVLRADPAPLVS